MSKALKVVTIGGGTGHYMLLCAAKLIQGLDITAVVSMADSGKSSGKLRDRYGALPPGDVLQCVVALSDWPGKPQQHPLRERFPDGPLEGDNIGNWFLTVASLDTGDFPYAIRMVGTAVGMRGMVLPVTVGQIKLWGRSWKGKIIEGEHQFDGLDKLLDHDDKVKEVWLQPNSLVLGQVREVVRSADFIILSPGDLFSSVIPVLLVNGMREVLSGSSAKLVHVCNLVTTRGQTDGFTVPDFVETLEQHLPRKIDIVCYHSHGIDAERAEQYAKQDKAYPVAVGDLGRLEGRQLLGSDYLSESELVRHAPRRLAQILGIVMGRLPSQKSVYDPWAHAGVAEG